MISVPYIKLDPNAVEPQRKSAGAVGYDLACLHDELFLGKETKKIRTGIALAIPAGYEGQIRLRSSLGASGCYMIPNSPGTIDCDYRGEICILLTRYNAPKWEDKFQAGERIAQIVFSPVILPVLKKVDRLDETERGTGGYGSTGRFTGSMCDDQC